MPVMAVFQKFGAKERPSQRIAQLDGWRGVSIVFVVVGHLINRRYSAHPDADYPNIAGVLSGWGVSIFFVISGFIITKLALREYDQSGRFSVRNFYTRRFFRIIPPFYLYLASVVLFGAFSLIAQRNSETLTAAAFVCNLPVASCGWFANHSWTLAYEEQFYITFPILFALVAHHLRKIIGLLFVALVTFPFIQFILHFGESWRAVASFAFGFSYICAGAAMAAYEEHMKRLVENRRALYISCGAAALLMGLLFLNATFAFPLGSPAAYLQSALNRVFLPVSIAWLVGSSVYQSNLFTRALTTPPLLFFGMISYSLYLWQQVFTAGRNLYISESLLLISPLMFVLATLSYYFVERPCVRLGKHLLSRLCKNGGTVGN